MARDEPPPARGPEVRSQATEAPASSAGPGDDGCCSYRTGPGGISADFLLETCSVTGRTAHGMIPYFDCQSYVLAVLDSYQAMQEALPKERRLCLPPELTARAVLAVVEAHFIYERDARRRAAQVILGALHKAYPCRK